MRNAASSDAGGVGERSPLVSAKELAPRLKESQLRIVDCRFSLADPEEGRRRYQLAHIPGAIYAHLNEDLSGPVVPGQTGRHPLPDPALLASKLGAWGISTDHEVVAYDQNDGSMAAARLWWLLRHLGHRRVSVLNGGLDAWQREDLPTQSGPESELPEQTYAFQVQPALTVSRSEVEAGRAMRSLFDARALARFSGEIEPIDARAGHIPGAQCLPFSSFVRDGKIISPDEIRSRLDAEFSGSDPSQIIVYCGSGVTACHLLLAAASAGFDSLRLYPGSWSEWIANPNAGIETGAPLRQN